MKTKLFLLFLIYNLQLGIQNLSAQGTTCATASPIVIGTCTGAQTISDFTQEVTTPAISCIGTGVFRREGWYSFTTTGAGSISVSSVTTSSPTNLAIQVLSGTCGSTLAQLGCSNVVTTNSSQTECLSVAIAAAGTYFIRILNIGTAINMGVSKICVNYSPANDNCSGAQSIVPSASCTSGLSTGGNLIGASQSLAVGSCTATLINAAVQDVWYSFIASNTTHMVTVIPSASLNVAFQVFAASCGGTSINCTDITNNLGFTESSAVTGLIIGNTYWIRVYNGTVGIPATTTFNIAVETVPLNDDCVNAISLVPQIGSAGATPGCNYVATDSGIPVNSYCGTSISEDDVWYSFVATVTSHSINVIPSSGFDPVVELFSGACGSLTSIGCGGSGNNTGITITQSFSGLTFGNTYYFRVYDYNALPASTANFDVYVSYPVPINDDCNSPVQLTTTASCVPLLGNVLGASQSFPGCSGNANDDVWYSFNTSATIGQSYTISVNSSLNLDAVFEVYSGACDSLTSLGCTNATGTGGTETLTTTTLSTLTSYRVRVYDATAAGYPSTTDFTICVKESPPNDNCPGTTLTPSVTCVNSSATFNLATPSGMASCGVGLPNNDEWFNFTATATTHIIGVTSAADIVFQIFIGSCGGTSLGCTNNITGGGMETLILTTIPGTTYWMRVYDITGTSTNNFTVCISTPPTNNECTGAIVLASNLSICTPTTGSVNGATQSQVATCGGTANDDVWYSFVALTTAHTIKLVGSASMNAVTEVFSGTCGSLTSLGCTNATTAGGTETTALTGLTVGVTYFIRVYDFAAGYPASTTFTICVSTPPPVNDNIAGGISLSVSPICNPTTGNVLGATQSLTANCGGDANDDVWYYFYAPAGSRTIKVVGSAGFNAVVEVYGPSSTTLLACVNANNTNGGTEIISLTSVVNGYYDIRVYDYGSTVPSTTSFTICVQLSTNDECAGATTLTPSSSCSPVSFNFTGITPSSTSNSCYSSSYPDIWFKFVATSTTHRLTFGGFDCVDGNAQVFSGDCNTMTSILCSPLNGLSGAYLPNMTGLTVGATYYIRLFNFYNYSTSNPNFTVCVTTLPGSTCGTAYPISLGSCVSKQTMFDNLVESTTPSSTCNASTSIYREGWYSFTTTSTQALTVTASSYISCVTPANLNIQILSGTCGSTLTEISCANNINSSSVQTESTNFTVASAGTYFIRLIGTNFISLKPMEISQVCVSTVCTPTLPIITGTPTLCNLGSVTYQATSVGATTYTWSVPAGLTITSGQGTSSITCNIANGTIAGSVTVSGSNGCGVSPMSTLSVTKLPQSPGPITGPISFCGIGTPTFSIAPVAGVTSYNWSVPSVMTILSGQGTTAITIGVTTNFNSANLGVASVNACGSSYGTGLLVYGNFPSTPNYLYGLTNVCGLTSTTYSCSASTGATAYQWVVPSWMSIASGQGTTLINVNITGAPVAGNTITVAGTNTCGTGSVRSLNITTAATTPGTITGPSNTCGLTSATYSIAPVSDAVSYVWTPATGQTILTGQGTTTITVSVTATTSTVTAVSYVRASSVNACGTTSSQRLLSITRCLSPLEFSSSSETEGSELLIYPNPTERELRIADFGVRIESVKIFNILGKCMLNQQLTTNNQQLSIDVSALAKGLYFLEVAGERSVKRGKFVKE